MHNRVGRGRYLFWLALGVTSMAAAMAVLLMVEMGQRRVVQGSIGLRTDSITAPAVECEREFLLFRQALDRAVNGRVPPDPDELILRYDLFLSRLTLLRDGSAAELLAKRPEYQSVVPKLTQWAAAADAVMLQVPPSPAALAELLRQINALAVDVHALTLAANSQTAHLLEAQAHELLDQTEKIVALTLAQMVVLLVAAVALFRRHKRQEQERRTLEQISDDLRAAHDLAQTSLQKLHDSQDQLARAETRATLSTVIASVSHELSTPLGNSLMMASNLVDQGREFQKALDANDIKRSDLTNFVAAVRKGHDLMERNLQRAVALLRTFRQVANDQASEQRRTFELATVVQEIVDTLAPSLKRYPHRVDLAIPEGITLDSYPGPLGQVMINLVNNAYLHAFEGRSNGLLTISASASDGRVLLTVADNGVGMSAEAQKHLFQPFFTTKAQRGGTGLGLSIVSNLVTKTLGGSINVRSTEGSGTTWLIDLPLVAPGGQT